MLEVHVYAHMRAKEAAMPPVPGVVPGKFKDQFEQYAKDRV